MIGNDIDLVIDRRVPEEAAQDADPLTLHAVGLQKFRVVLLDIPDTPCRDRIVRVIADEHVEHLRCV